jgi:hypothetical protein
MPRLTSSETVDDAIDRSISHTEIVTIDFTPGTYAELVAVCDDYVDRHDGVSEFWGIHMTDSAEWRVHMRGVPLEWYGPASEPSHDESDA